MEQTSFKSFKLSIFWNSDGEITNVKILQSYKANEKIQQLEEVQQESALSSGFGSKRDRRHKSSNYPVLFLLFLWRA